MATRRTARVSRRTSAHRRIRAMPSCLFGLFVAMATSWSAATGVPQSQSAFCFLQEYLQNNCEGPTTLSDTAVTGMCVWKNDTQVPSYAGVMLLNRTAVNWTYYQHPNCTGVESEVTYPIATCMTDEFDCTDDEDASAEQPCSREVTCYFATPGNGDNAGGELMNKFLASVLVLTALHTYSQTRSALRE